MELLERLAAATVGSRELDALIWIAAGNRDGFNPLAEGYRWEFEAEEDGAINCYAAMVGEKERPSYSRQRRPEPFSTSLDAALTLRLPWMSIELTESAAGPPTFTRARIWDWRRSPTGFDPGNEWKSEGNRPLALNFCSAIIKARGLP